MVKKGQIRKNSRASRRLETEEPELDIEVESAEQDGKSRVLQIIAEKELRENGSKLKAPSGLEDELTAISRGTHPDQKSNSPAKGKVAKNTKKNKRSKHKQERAEMVRDMLNEKIQLAKKRHRIVREFRGEEKEDD